MSSTLSINPSDSLFWGFKRKSNTDFPWLHETIVIVRNVVKIT